MGKYAPLFNDYYAERLGTLCLLDPPRLAMGMWAIAKNFCEESTVAKIRFLGKSDIPGTFSELFDAETAAQVTELMDSYR